ncbi:MAG: redoxin domain-containing protein, partial [Chloroflexi bacterium]|nr:redoxin domain-containing protein [Chloroflexota bacterium]
ESHTAFCESLGGCPFPVASDPDGEAAKLFGAIGPDGRVRAVYVLDESGIVLHKVPWYQPGNIGHLMSIFEALGMDGNPA